MSEVKPSLSDAQRSIAIRCASKRGQYVSQEDSNWNATIWERYPEWYQNTEADIHRMTKPFGAK